MSKYLKSEASSSYSFYPSLEKSENEQNPIITSSHCSLGTDSVTLTEVRSHPTPHPRTMWLP